MKASIFILLILAVNSVFAMPAEVLLMRHAEKPAVGNELSPQGWARARALPKLFSGRPEFLKFGLPVALYAMAPSHENGSVRAIQTLQFLARALNLQTETQFTKDEVSQLINQIRSDSRLNGRTIVICWEHKMIPVIAHGFGITVPDNWPSEQFDRVWSLDFSDKGQIVSFKNLPEKLLPTDSQK
jgi:hypothetical protein